MIPERRTSPRTSRSPRSKNTARASAWRRCASKHWRKRCSPPESRISSPRRWRPQIGHHRARLVHRARRTRRAPRPGDGALRNTGANAARRRRAGSVRRGAGGLHARGGVAAAIAVEEPAVRDGGDVPDAATEGGRSTCGAGHKMKKAPTNRGLLTQTWITPLCGRPCYFFFLAGAFFFGAAFLVALFID